MPEAIVVAVHNVSRERDLRTPTLEGEHGGQRFTQFLAEELIPFIDARYRTQPFRCLIGHSQGGSFATYVLATRPETFRFYLAIDPPLHLTPGIKECVVEVLSQPENTQRLVSCERGLGWFAAWSELESSIAPHAYAERIEMSAVTHENMFIPSLFRGLQSLFHDYALEGDDLTLADVQGHYDNLSRAFGYTISPPEGALTQAAMIQVFQGKGRAALALYEHRDELYGSPTGGGGPEGAMLREQAQALVEAGPDRDWTELYAQLDLPSPAPEAMAPFLGEWRGHVDVQSGTSYDIEISFVLREGSVVTNSAVFFPGGNTMEAPPDFVTVRDDGALRWGSRGRGVGLNVITVSLADGELVGVSEGLGIVPPPAFGAMPVPDPVKLRRK